jgi:putative oxidoreductase
MDIVVLVGRILFSLVFLTSSVGHLTQTDQMAGHATAKGVPAARLAVLGSGVLILVGGLMVLLGLWGDLGALFLVAFLVPTALIIHGFWRETDPTAKFMEQIHFFKDTGLAGAALLVFALFAYAGSDLGLTLTGPLFDLR